MPETFQCENLPEIDQREIKRGRCPWCLERLTDASLHGGEGDQCPTCLDSFVGKLTIED